ncbi:MAG: TIGR03936 family radical SAM-associated protein [Clostridia bacterium]|nr:TIGR03936 family radical SAM-associated protein [Clostridia bacterium]
MSMRVLLEYTREERVKYISHLDLMRSMQRAIRRAGIPIAYSQGFNPHPVMAFTSALSVGVTSEREYADIVLTESMSIAVLKEQLNHALPKGITLREAIVIDEKTPSLMSLVERADYELRVDLLDKDQTRQAEIDWNKAIEAYENTAEIWIEKKSKKRVSTVNLKDGVWDIRIDEENPSLVHLEMKLGNKGSVKPDSVIHAILKLSEQLPNPEAEDLSDLRVSINRTGLYFQRNGKWITPLALKKG